MAQLENMEAIEKRLWKAADTLRSNSELASNEYFLPVMGLIFLRHAYSRFLAVADDVAASLPSRGGRTRALTKEDFSQKSAIFLKPEARFDALIALTDADDRAEAIIHAMESIEADYTNLRDQLPKQEYRSIPNDGLGNLLRYLNPEGLRKASGDIFGRIYEYFLTQFADQGAQDGGEFFSPISLVQLLVNAIEPDHGIFLQAQRFRLAEITEKQGFARNAAIVAAKEAVNVNDQSRKRFEVMSREVFKKFKACINVTGINDYRDSRDAIDIIYKSLQKDREQADISDILPQLHGIVESSIRTNSVVAEPNPAKGHLYDISKIDFERLRRLLLQNPLRSDFQEHYEKLAKEYNQEKDRVTSEQTFEALLKRVQKLDKEETRAVREGLDEESLALFDLIKKPELSAKEIKHIKKVAEEQLKTLKAERLKVSNWREKETTRDAAKQRSYDFLFNERTGLPVEDFQDEEIKSLTEQVFWHVYRVYPTLPSPYYGSAA